MPRIARWVIWAASLVALASVLVSTDAHAASRRTRFLIERLHYPPKKGVSNDFRVRTSAALALGASNDDEAVGPLCDALSDPNAVVRQASAVALKRLGRSQAVGCLKRRLGSERSKSVKLQITRALDELDKGKSSSDSGGPYKPKSNPNAKYYVQIAKVNNKTDRSADDIERVVLDAVRRKLDSSGDFQIAPEKESTAQARAVMKKRNMKGFYLSFAVDRFDYSGGNLRVRVRCAVSNYPGKALQGEVPAGLTQTGVSPSDHGAEDNLMKMAAERAVELFAANFP